MINIMSWGKFQSEESILCPTRTERESLWSGHFSSSDPACSHIYLYLLL